MIGGEFSDGGRSKQNMRGARKAQSVVVARATESGHPVCGKERNILLGSDGDVNLWFLPEQLHASTQHRARCVCYFA